MNVLSLCDGYSCGQIALKECGIKVDKYFASEIKKMAIKTTLLNFPDTIQLGDLTKWREWDLPKIDLLLFGSPCQDFSSINTTAKSDKYGLKGEKSSLFFVCLDILKDLMSKNPDILFLCENVKGSDVIGNILHTNALSNDAITFCGCHRRRIFYTNIAADTYTDLFGEKWWHSKIKFPKKQSGKKIKIDLDDVKNEITDYYFYKRVDKGIRMNIITTDNAVLACVIRTRTDLLGANVIVFDDNTRRYLNLREMRDALCLPEWVKFPDMSLSSIQDLIGDGWNIEQVKFIFKHLKLVEAATK